MKKLIVENFGKIESAEIDMNKMMLFVGDNNSGKSYLASLIYGLYGLMSKANFFEKYEIDFADDIFDGIKEKINNSVSNSMYNQEKINLDFTNEQKNIAIALNRFLNDNKEKLVEAVFRDKIEINRLEIEIEENEIMYVNVVPYMWSNDNDVFVVTAGNSSINCGFIVEIEKQGFKERIIKYSIMALFKLALRDKTSYLPVSRTGFMLTHKDLVANALKNRYDNFSENFEQVELSRLSKPTSDFLTTISTITNNKTKEVLQDVVEFIEKNVISGKINVSDTPTPNYTYVADGSDVELPMYLSSGVVTEMTPLLLYLKHVNFDTLIIEEPEMCLHPKLQWALTRALIKATHKDKQFILTTHSEAIVQHINDMIKLNQNEDRVELQQEFNYQDDDLISENEVSIYQFIVNENNKTEVKKVPYTDKGFVVTTFVDNLRQRLTESRTFRE